MVNHLTEVIEAISDPDEVRQSRSDQKVYLFYRQTGGCRWICAVAKNDNGEGFLITAYPADAIKEGITIWKK